ncbi:MAG: NAD-dependent epimerase/dehydratase family protein [Candidatus Diapherotrites archaeon]
MEKLRFLVTGSSGFIGQRLAAKLRKKGHWVKEFDLDKGPDILKEEDCKKAVKDIGTVIHLAAVLDERSPLLWKVNVQGTENILKAASEGKVERFIHLSSVGVHGEQKGAADENASFNPETDYEKSKMQAELKVQEFQELMHITILRPALVLGPNEYWKKIVKLVGKNFPLIGNGKNKWQTIYIDDLVDALAFCAEHEETMDETFILAEEHGITLEELCLEIKRNLGLKPKLMKLPFWLGKPLAYVFLVLSPKSLITPQHLDRLARNREYSIGKIKKFGWKPKWNTKNGIKETVKALKEA